MSARLSSRSFVPDRRVRQRQELLDDVALGAGAKPIGPRVARRRIECRREDRRHVGSANAGLITPFSQPLARVGKRRRFAAPPGGERRRLERLAEQPLGRSPAGTPSSADDSSTLSAERVGHEHVSRAPRLHEARDAQRRVGAQFQRIAVVVVETPEDRVHGTEPGHGLEEHAIVPNGEIAALDERKPELAREVGVLEVGLVVGSRRQQHDVRGHRRQTARADNNVSLSR